MAQPAQERDELLRLTTFMIGQGFLAFPLQHGGKRPFLKGRGFQDANADLAGIEKWIGAPGELNVGLVRPENDPDNVFLWDVDGGDGFETWREHWKALNDQFGPLPRTLTDKTPSDGRHVIYRWRTDLYGPPPKGDKLLGFTVRWPWKGYIVGPGSTVDGVTYVTNKAPIVDFPESWARAAQAYAKPAEGAMITIGGSLELPVVVGEGGRYDAIRTLVAQLYNRGLPADFIWPVVRDQLAPRFSVGLAENELRERFDRAWDKIEERLGAPRSTPEAVAARASGRVVTVLTELDDLDLADLPIGAFPPDPDPIAFEGMLGQAVDAVLPVSSASRVGLLTSMASIAGAILATTVNYISPQTSSFMVALVGESAIGRKGTAMGAAWTALTAANAFGEQRGVRVSGAGSGEGVIRHVESEAKKTGLARILLKEGEFSSVLVVSQRQGTTLSQVIRNAFDREPLMNITRSGTLRVEAEQYQLGALVGITPDELRALIGAGTDIVNGFANRWLWVPVVGRDVDPDLSRLPAMPHELATGYRYALENAGKYRHQPFGLTDDAITMLKDYYRLIGPLPGMGGTLARRLVTIACRLALVHASVEIVERDEAIVDDYDVARAVAVTEYCRAGFSWVFGESIAGSPAAVLLLRTLMTHGPAMKLSELAPAMYGRRSDDRVRPSIDELKKSGAVSVERRQGATGRPVDYVELSGVIGGVSGGVFPARPRSRAGAGARERVETVDDGDGRDDLSEKSDKSTFERETPSDNPSNNPFNNPPENSAKTQLICHFYAEHQLEHRWSDARQRFVCPICDPDPAL